MVETSHCAPSAPLTGSDRMWEFIPPLNLPTGQDGASLRAGNTRFRCSHVIRVIYIQRDVKETLRRVQNRRGTRFKQVQPPEAFS